MVRIALIALALVALGVAPAVADTRTRIVLADEDPELLAALTRALAPWHVELFVDATAIRDDDDAIHRAASWNARFVVWRQAGQLVVFDRERAQADRRPTRAGALDPPGAAAAALTVKTMLRLPPPPTGIEPPPPSPPPPPPPADGRELRFDLGGAARLAFANSTDVGARQFDAVMFRPTRALGLRFGLAAQLGSAIAIDQGGFKGDWSDTELLAVASWSFPIDAHWDFEPQVGLGVTRSRLDGTVGGTSRGETDLGFAAHAGIAVRWHLSGVFSIVTNLTVRGTPGSPAYTTTQGMGKPQVLFQAPGITTGLGLALGVDFGL